MRKRKRDSSDGDQGGPSTVDDDGDEGRERETTVTRAKEGGGYFSDFGLRTNLGKGGLAACHVGEPRQADDGKVQCTKKTQAKSLHNLS
ncbi:unnamed protein product [Linum trigynum]|uniref:Uncharacterized protein n=1 Tax=Linum trigynum TaxID=586398 RepID=A0AAV2E3G7_9ROSI